MDGIVACLKELETAQCTGRPTAKLSVCVTQAQQHAVVHQDLLQCNVNIVKLKVRSFLWQQSVPSASCCVNMVMSVDCGTVELLLGGVPDGLVVQTAHTQAGGTKQIKTQLR